VTIGAAIRSHATDQPTRLALVATGFAPLTYAGLLGEIEATGAAIRARGFGARARIAISLPGGPQAALAIVAVACATTAMPLDPGLVLAEVEMRLALHRPDAIVLQRSVPSPARIVAQQRGIPILEADAPAGGALGLGLDRTPGETIEEAASGPQAPAFIVQTSGTSAAETKFVPWTHASMLEMADRLRTWFGLSPQDRCLCALPVHYGHGIIVCLLTPLLTGGSVGFPASPRAPDVDEWFGALRPTWYSGSPTLHLALLEQVRGLAPEPARHKLRFIVSGGADLPEETSAGLETSLGVPVLQHFGCTEAGVIATNCAPPSASRRDTCGIPWPGTLRIVAVDGSDLAPGETGEVLVGGATLTAGYLDAPALNRACFADGWFRTGDVGRLDADGFLTIHGRLKEIINRGGEKIGPIEVDAALMRHPAVLEAAAFAVSHPRLGEDVAAAVVVRPGSTLTAAELTAFLADRLAAFKVPRRIFFVDALPKGANGKVQRRQLSALVPNRQTTSPPQARADTLEQALLGIWRAALANPALDVDDDFFAAGGDSLLSMGIVLEIEKRLDRAVPEAVLFEAPTVRQLAARLADSLELRPSLLVQCGPLEAPPLILFHGDYDGGRFLMGGFVRQLARDHRLIVVAPHGIGADTVPESIEAMAADRLPLIMAAQPEGPYRLIGHCNGALVAFEAARLLKAAGLPVQWIGMIDPVTVTASGASRAILKILTRIAVPSPSPYWQDLTRDLARWVWWGLGEWQRIGLLSWSQRWALAKGSRKHLALPRLRLPSRGSRHLPCPDDHRYEFAMARYFPEPLEVPVTYFAAEYDGRPWRRISRELEIVELPDGAARRAAPDSDRLADHAHHFEWVTRYKADLAAYVKIRISKENG
jgi:acyl-CoA synthetase (AMP-forming)/AMP-acid ligase II/acyl carrier protein